MAAPAAVPLVEALDEATLGGKAVHLGRGLRDGLPVPDGFALPVPLVNAIVAGDAAALAELDRVHEALHGVAMAVRSSAIGEDSADASFAGQHQTVLNVRTRDELHAAVREVHDSAFAESALAYRQRMGLTGDPVSAVVVQMLVEPDSAGVVFTKDPVTGAEEIVIEASWGLGSSVVDGLVIPDRFRLSPSGEILERIPGRKDVVVLADGKGGTVTEEVTGDRVEALCLDDHQLGLIHELGTLTEAAFGHPRDIEFAFASGRLFLLQSRAVTT